MDNILRYYSASPWPDAILAAFCPHRRDMGRDTRAGNLPERLHGRAYRLGGFPDPILADHILEWA